MNDRNSERPAAMCVGMNGDGRQSQSRVLSGWKEIAEYLGRGVRTAQRWERLGLPVRRPNAHLRSAVVTTTAEIDTWVGHCGNGRLEVVSTVDDREQLRAQIDGLRRENEELRRKFTALSALFTSEASAKRNLVA